ncbi:hypothetical protein ACFE04_010908 [Oxalis oulophora]
MGETTCLMQPFSYASGLSNEEGKNPIHALGQSISFGKYVSESLAWEKWSTFSHNRYVEEAERYSRPGSVAQKKAFFEAHYKQMAARKKAAEEAALLEKLKTVSSGGPEKEANQESEITLEIPQIEAVKEVEVGNGDSVAVVDNSGEHGNSSVEANKSENDVVPENSEEVKTSMLIGVVGEDREVEESEPSGSTQEEKPLLKDFLSKQDKSLSTSERKPKPSFAKSSSHGRASRMPIPTSPARVTPSIRSTEVNSNYATPVGKKSANALIGNSKATKLPFSSSAKFMSPTISTQKKNVTPISKVPAMYSTDKKGTIAKSSQKSINFTPARELTRLTSSFMRKFDSSRIGSYAKPSKDCSTPVKTYSKMSKECSTPARTPVTASVNVEKPQLVTPWSENERVRTPCDLSASASKTRAKWNFLPTDCSKLLSACRNKSPSPNVSTTPFRLRTEERAVKRKEASLNAFVLSKLEEKFNANEQNVQQQATLKQRAEYELKKLRPTLCFKARPLPEFYKERGSPNNDMKKVLLSNPQSPKCRRRIASNSDQNMTISQPQLWPSSIKSTSCSKQVLENRSRTPTRTPTPTSSYSFSSRRTKVTHENTSPNIQQRR